MFRDEMEPRFVKEPEPVNPERGDLWIKGPDENMRWDGEGWISETQWFRFYDPRSYPPHRKG